MYDLQSGVMVVKSETTKTGYRKLSDIEKKSLVWKGKIPDYLLNRIPLPKRVNEKCLLEEHLYTGCSYCGLVKLMEKFGRENFRECLRKYHACRHRQKQDLIRTLCTLCEQEDCPDKLPGLHRNMPVEVSRDGTNWIKAHVAYASKGVLFCYKKGGTSATVTEMERWKLVRNPVQKHPYKIADVNALEFCRVHEWGSKVEKDTLVTSSPNFQHPLFYATGNMSEHGVEVYSQGETSYSGKETTRVILEFPVWKLI